MLVREQHDDILLHKQCICSQTKASQTPFKGLEALIMPVEGLEPSTLAGLVFETSAYTVPPHWLVCVDV